MRELSKTDNQKLINQRLSGSSSSIVYLKLQDLDYRYYLVRKEYFDLMIKINKITIKLRRLENDVNKLNKNLESLMTNNTYGNLNLSADFQKIYCYQSYKEDLAKLLQECSSYKFDACFWDVSKYIGIVEYLGVNTLYMDILEQAQEINSFIGAGSSYIKGGHIDKVDNIANEIKISRDMIYKPWGMASGFGSNDIGNGGSAFGQSLSQTDQFILVLYDEENKPDFTNELFGVPVEFNRQDMDKLFLPS